MNGGQNMDISKMKSDFKAIIGKGPLYSKGQHGKALGNSLWSFDGKGFSSIPWKKAISTSAEPALELKKLLQRAIPLE